MGSLTVPPNGADGVVMPFIECTVSLGEETGSILLYVCTIRKRNPIADVGSSQHRSTSSTTQEGKEKKSYFDRGRCEAAFTDAVMFR